MVLQVRQHCPRQDPIFTMAFTAPFLCPDAQEVRELVYRFNSLILILKSDPTGLRLFVSTIPSFPSYIFSMGFIGSVPVRRRDPKYSPHYRDDL